MGDPGNIQLADHNFTFCQLMIVDSRTSDVQRIGLKNVKQILLSNPLPVSEKVVVRKGSTNAISVAY